MKRPCNYIYSRLFLACCLNPIFAVLKYLLGCRKYIRKFAEESRTEYGQINEADFTLSTRWLNVCKIASVRWSDFVISYEYPPAPPETLFKGFTHAENILHCCEYSSWRRSRETSQTQKRSLNSKIIGLQVIKNSQFKEFKGLSQKFMTRIKQWAHENSMLQ